MVVHDLNQLAFPTLDETQIAELARCSGATFQRHAGRDDPDRGRRPRLPASSSSQRRDRDRRRVGRRAARRSPSTARASSPATCRTSPGNPRSSAPSRAGDARSTRCRATALREMLNQCPALCDIILQAFIARRQLLRESESFTGLRVIGSRYSQDTFRIRDFLAKNRVLFTWLDLEADPDGGPAAQAVRRDRGRHAGRRLRAPAAAAQSVQPRAGRRDRPAPAARAGGLRPRRRRCRARRGWRPRSTAPRRGWRPWCSSAPQPAGRPARSMRIENYLGFPTGITGSELADRAVLQANRFGARLSVPSSGREPGLRRPLPGPASRRRRDRRRQVPADRDRRGLPPPRASKAAKSSRAAASTTPRRPTRRELCRGARRGRRRRRQLRRTGRRVPRRQSPQGLPPDPRRRPQQEHVELPGAAHRADREHRAAAQHRGASACTATAISPRSTSANSRTGEERTSRDRRRCSASSARCRERTGCRPEIETDATRLRADRGRPWQVDLDWTATTREPFLLETSRRGVFAAGDVRSGSVKRVASAVGEGSMAVQFVHEYLKEM